MKANVDAFNLIASDVGVVRYKKEDDASFCLRTAYSSARFMVGVACMDDGMDASQGISKQGINRRFKKWVSQLDSLCPGLYAWFDADGKGIQAVYNRLIDAGEILPNGFEGTFLATPPRLSPVGKGVNLLLGFYDSSDRNHTPCGIQKGKLVTSGLFTVALTGSGKQLGAESWWIDEIELRSWEKANGFEGVMFADAKTSKWNVNRSDVWVEEPYWMGGLSLARVEGTGVDPILFVARLKRGRVMLSRIEWNQAQSLFFRMRDDVGNRAVARYVALDEKHARMTVPVGFVPGRVNRILDAVTWPVDDADDRLNRIARREVLPLIGELLSACYIGFEEARNG